jgi:hypothetical protein
MHKLSWTHTIKNIGHQGQLLEKQLQLQKALNVYKDILKYVHKHYLIGKIKKIYFVTLFTQNT